jgi:hypothetical protein
MEGSPGELSNFYLPVDATVSVATRPAGTPAEAVCSRLILPSFDAAHGLSPLPLTRLELPVTLHARTIAAFARDRQRASCTSFPHPRCMEMPWAHTTMPMTLAAM